MIGDNPNVSLETADCSVYTRRIALKDDYHMKRRDLFAYTPLQFNYLRTLALTFIILLRQNQLIGENLPNNAPVPWISIAMNTNSAFALSYTETQSWYQQVDPRQTKMFRGGEPIVDFDAADNCG